MPREGETARGIYMLTKRKDDDSNSAVDCAFPAKRHKNLRNSKFVIRDNQPYNIATLF